MASLAWSAYLGLRDKTPEPRPDVVARTVRVRLREADAVDVAGHERVIDITIDETLRAIEGTEQDAENP